MIKKGFILTVILSLFLLIVILLHVTVNESSQAYANTDIVKLPEPKYDSKVSIEKALHTRRSIREYKDKSLELAEVSQLLWAAQGITDPLGLRTAPSAGALYPIEVYFVAGNVNNLSDGVYKYIPHKHELVKVMQGDKRSELCSAAFNQPCIKNSAAIIILAAFYERTTRKYGERGIRYVHMEIGHAAQNVYLQSVSLNLGTVVIGAFDDNKVKRTLRMSDAEQPLCIMPVGRK
jgi:SagB-type dehydrogenase family enzyme